jgi:hypothetical protein
MQYRGIEYTVVQGIERGVWKWSASVAGVVIMGQEAIKSEAVAAAEKAIAATCSARRRNERLTTQVRVTGRLKPQYGEDDHEDTDDPDPTVTVAVQRGPRHEIKPIHGPHLVYGFLTTPPNAIVEPIHPKACQ